MFESIDDALETVMLIKAYQQGDKSPIYKWLKDARMPAAATVSRFCHCSYRKAIESLEGAEDRFWKQLDDFNVMRIMPLFAMFCKCLHVEVIRRPKLVPYNDGRKSR